MAGARITHKRAKPGRSGYRDYKEKTGTAKERLEPLLDRYGTRAEAIAELMSGDVPLKYLPQYSRREIEFLAAQEQVIHLDDLILRRTLMGILGQVNRPLLDELAGIAAPVLGWSPETTRNEVERAANILQARYGISLEAPIPVPG